MVHEVDVEQSSNEFRLVLFLCVATALFIVYFFKRKIWNYVFGGDQPRLFVRERRGQMMRITRSVSRLSLSRLNLLMMQRDFTGDDYEMLSRLDNDVENQRYPGASAAEIARLPTYFVTGRSLQQAGDASVSGNRTCVICLDVFEEGDSNRILPCMHHFHQRCIDTWLQNRAICPVCKCPASSD